jgi:hypothetical protein
MNGELLFEIYEVIEGAITRDNVLKRLFRRIRFQSAFGAEISFISSHFGDFTISELSSLESPILCEILSSRDLRVPSEDFLYERVWSLVSSEGKPFSLLEFVRFEFLSREVIARFVSDSASRVSESTSSVWSSLGRRLILAVSPEAPNDHLSIQETRICPRDGSSLDGIISHLTRKFGGHVGDTGVVGITLSSENSTCRARNAADLQNRNSYFQSNDAPNSWICYDFKKMEVTPTHYSILSLPYAAGSASHPRSWCLEVSTDGNSWTEIHRCSDSSDLNGSNLIGTYEVARSVKCRFARWRQIGKNHAAMITSRSAALKSTGFFVSDAIAATFIWLNSH